MKYLRFSLHAYLAVALGFIGWSKAEASFADDPASTITIGIAVAWVICSLVLDAFGVKR